MTHTISRYIIIRPVLLLALPSLFWACSEEAQYPPNSQPLFPVSIDNKDGYINAQGEVVIAPQFDFAGDFQEGCAIVCMYGCIDRTKNPFSGAKKHRTFLIQIRAVWQADRQVITCLFQTGRLREEWFFIDEQGRRLTKKHFDHLQDFSEGLAAVNIGGRTDHYCLIHGGKWGYIDRFGKVAIPIQYEDAQRFSEGLAAVKQEGRWKYIDQSGQVAIDTPYKFVYDFSEGLARISPGDRKEGYINRMGKAVITPRYVSARDFSEGLAMVWKDKSCGFINHEGDFIIEPKFEWAAPFHEGRAHVSFGKKVGFIDKQGNPIISPQYQYAGDFACGIAPVSIDDKWGYIDTAGEWVMKPQFHCAAKPVDCIAQVGHSEYNCHTGRYDYLDRQGQYIWKHAD